MRAGPLSDDKVIALLNSSFVPVFTSNEDYYGKPVSVEKEELAVLDRIHHQGYAAKKSVGTVHVYILKEDGDLWDTLNVSAACEKSALLDKMKEAVAELKPKTGEPVIAPHNLSQPRLAGGEEADLPVHITARRDSRGSWGEFPSENWLLLNGADRALLAPPGDAKIGSAWEIDPALVKRLCTHVHPQTEDCSDEDRNRIEAATLTAKWIAKDLVWLDGKLKMKRTFYPNKADNNFVESRLEGYLNPQTKKFTLVTRDGATYAKEKFSAAIVSSPVLKR